jgi:UDP-N-acetyl-2-amino-2-deoxyglucuronate dehydrogenase
MDKVNFGIIGCGRISYRHIEAIQENKNAELVSLCDLQLDRAKERNQGLGVKLYQDYNEMLKKEHINVVCINTPSGMHAEHSLDIIENHKKNIIIEKPMCLNVHDGMKMIKSADKNNIKLFIVHQNRFNKAIIKIRSMLDQGKIGKVALATVRLRWSRNQAYYDRDPWRGIWALDGGTLTNQTIHHIDILRWLVGEVESVSAIGATQFVDIEVEDTACAWIKFKNGALGIIEATTAIRPENNDLEASVSIVSDTGTLIVEGIAANKITTWTGGDINVKEFSEDPPNVYGFGHNQIIDNAVDVLVNGGDPLVTSRDALKSIRLLSAIYASMELDGKEVFMIDNPISKRLGVLRDQDEGIADLYRTK